MDTHLVKICLMRSLINVILVTSLVSSSGEDPCYSIGGFSNLVWQCTRDFVPNGNITGETLIDWSKSYCSEFNQTMACVDAELQYCVLDYRIKLKLFLEEKRAFCNASQPVDWIVKESQAKSGRSLLSLDCMNSLFFSTVENYCRKQTVNFMLVISEEQPVFQGISQQKIAADRLLTCVKRNLIYILETPKCQGHSPGDVYFTLSVAGNVMFRLPFALHLDELDYILTRRTFLS